MYYEFLCLWHSGGKKLGGVQQHITPRQKQLQNITQQSFWHKQNLTTAQGSIYLQQKEQKSNSAEYSNSFDVFIVDIYLQSCFLKLDKQFLNHTSFNLVLFSSISASVLGAIHWHL